MTSSTVFGIGRRRDVALPMFGDGIFTQEGAHWKESRDLLRLQLQHKYYDDLEIFRAAVDRLIHVVSECRGTVDLQPLFFRTTFETTTSFVFGKSTSIMKSTYGSKAHRFGAALDTAQEWIIRRLRFAGFYWLIDSREFRQACQDIQAFVDRNVDDIVQKVPTEMKHPKTHSFIQCIAKTTSDRSALRAQTISILAAGRDTTASLLSWVL